VSRSSTDNKKSLAAPAPATPTILSGDTANKGVLMKRRLRYGLVTSAALLLTGSVLAAHHAESAQFDSTKPVEVRGVIKKVEWANPHIWFYVDVKDDVGGITTWGFSGYPPGFLVRRGFTKNTLKIGDVVTVRGSRAKDGSNNASGFSVTFADGRQVFPGALAPNTGAATATP
jgi:hypothetical protein